MEIRTLSTGSKEGNCFVISDGYTKLMLDCGISIKKIQKALNFKLREVKACLVTHRHGDHTKGLAGVLNQEIESYIGAKEIEKLGINHHRLNGIEPMEQFQIGTWTILPFDVQHDTEQPLGYLMQSSATGEKLLFATDTYYIEYYFSGMTHMLIECNHSLEILTKNIENGTLPMYRAKRVSESHFSIENLLVFLKACDLSKLQEIRLIHLSDTNSAADHFKDVIQKATGVPTYIEGGE